MASANHVDLTAIMTALGGRQAMQDVLGVGASAISNYVARGSVPTHVRSKLYNALTARGYQVRLDDLSIFCGPDAATSQMKKPMVLLIIGGGIAAYKALETARRMQQLGLDVTGVMTKSASQFITPLSVAALTNQKCYDDLFSLTDEAEMGHIRLARSADLVLVMPATANLMARAACGLADDLATTILLATTAPILMAPAMNPAMWAHPATIANQAILRQRGIHMIGPTEGDTACGEIGSGRMSEPADIAATAFELAVKRPQSLAGKTAIVTAGPTVEPIDSVRFIANHSSGKTRLCDCRGTGRAGRISYTDQWASGPSSTATATAGFGANRPRHASGGTCRFASRYCDLRRRGCRLARCRSTPYKIKKTRSSHRHADATKPC